MANVESMTAIRPQVSDMLAPGSEEDFMESLPDSTANPEDVTPTGRKKRRDAGQPKGPRKPKATPIQGEIVVDEKLERAKKKYASLGGGTAIKSLFVMLDKPLDRGEEEDIDDYFYLLSKKAQLDPSESWIVMFFCALILLGRLLGTRTAIGSEIKKLFTPKEAEEAAENAAE